MIEHVNVCVHGALQWTGAPSKVYPIVCIPYSHLIPSVPGIIGSRSTKTLTRIKWLLEMNEWNFSNKWWWIQVWLGIKHHFFPCVFLFLKLLLWILTRPYFYYLKERLPVSGLVIMAISCFCSSDVTTLRAIAQVIIYLPFQLASTSANMQYKMQLLCHY